MNALLSAALKRARMADIRVAFEDSSVNLHELVDLAIGDETYAWRAASLLIECFITLPTCGLKYFLTPFRCFLNLLLGNAKCFFGSD